MIIFIFFLNTFVIGKTKEISTYGVQNLLVTSEEITFNPAFMTSVDVMNWYSYRIKDGIMYIKIRSVLVGVISQKSVVLKGDFSKLEKIMVIDNRNKKIIWENK